MLTAEEHRRFVRELMRRAALPEDNIAATLPKGVFDYATIRTIGDAFDAACKQLHKAGQPAQVYEIMAKRIVEAARSGEHSVTGLRDAALAGLYRGMETLHDRA